MSTVSFPQTTSRPSYPRWWETPGDHGYVRTSPLTAGDDPIEQELADPG